ncbi:MAG: PVC-type heme-binding CxxCH protein [Gemmataceae bacterium]
MRRILSCFLLWISVSPVLAQLPPDKALVSMKPGEGLQVDLFASEPMLITPTAIDIDPVGRVWVAEAVNYRCHLRRIPLYRKEGDRIQILVDEKGDGKATKAITFYQGPELIAPIGICVIPIPTNVGKENQKVGYRVLVAQSPDILEFWDRNGDLKADGPPTKFLTGFGGIDHDHGVHGLNLGPDGKLYFTVGDQGVKGLQSKDGKGKSWSTNNSDCQAGTVWRVDLDGKNLEMIAHNFRNNYECCVDSFGEIWLSDNDDDGNQQTRICHVLPGGNYGYWPRGAGQTHWHEEQPGIVHKTLRTGFGSPTGITFYEGSLLPKQYRGDLIHCDAGPREVRYFKRIPKGAGYELEKMPMLTSTDNWFRPSAVRVAPDGSVFVADWYDPGVGGHGMGDWTRGRIYRLTPTGHKGYHVPEVKIGSPAKDLLAMSSPCNSTRNLARTAIQSEPFEQVQEYIQKQGHNLDQGLILAVMSFIQTKMPGAIIADEFAFPVNVERLNQMGIRQISSVIRTIDKKELAKLNYGIDTYASKKSNRVKSEILILMGQMPVEEAWIKRFYQYAKEYSVSDRFYLSTLNIACGTDPARRDAILAEFDRHFPEWNDQVADLVWELRPKSMLPRLGQLLNDEKKTPAQKARIVDILAISPDIDAGKTVLGLLAGNASPEVQSRALDNLKLSLPTKWSSLKSSDELKKTMKSLLASPASRLVGLQLASIAPESCDREQLLSFASDKVESAAVRKEAIRAISLARGESIVRALEKLSSDSAITADAVSGIARQIGSGRNDDAVGQLALKTLKNMLTSSASTAELKAASLSALAGTRAGTQWLLKQKQDGTMPAELVTEAGKLLRNSPFQGERNRALQLFPASGKLDIAKLPSLAALAKKTGNAKAGEKLFLASQKNEMQCMKCHKVNGQGGEIGPDLSAIGIKGSKENLFESILYPSRAIADQFVSWSITTADGQTITGLLVKETETAVTIRDANGKDTVIDSKNVESRKKSLVSLMPEDLVKTLTEDELVDLVAYLATLKTEKK